MYLIALSWTAGCETPGQATRAAEVRKRQVRALTPVNVKQKLAERDEKNRLYDAEGKLLPSDDIVGGVRLPRGLTPRLTVQNRHYFHTKVSLVRLRAYFGPRLVTAKIIPDGPSTYKYVGAKTRDTDQPHIVNVRLGPTAKSLLINEIMIEDISSSPIRKIVSFERSRAQLKALREHAE